MALFKPLYGSSSRISFDDTPFHAGYVYFTDDGFLYFDMNVGTEDAPIEKRIKLNAGDAETLLGTSLSTILKSSDAEIPTSKAVLDKLKSYALTTHNHDDKYAVIDHEHNLSELNNDSGFITKSVSDLTNYYTSQSVDAKVGVLQTEIDKKANASHEHDAVYSKLNHTHNLSDLNNDAGFITKTVSDLTNYYKKTETYTKTEINNMVSAIPKFKIEVTTTLPTSGNDTTIYLVPVGNDTNNIYSEYIYINNKWEKLGEQKVDLSNYYQKTDTYSKEEVDNIASGKSDTTHTHNYAGSSSVGGSATAAIRLEKSAGSATQPVYFKDGQPVETTYSLNKTVPADAKFTDTVYTLPAAGSALGGVKSGGDVTISSGVITVKDDSHNHTIANVDNLQSSLDSKAKKETGVFYIEGNGTEAGVWLGTHTDIAEYYSGLMIAFKLNTAGVSGGSTLNINSLGAVEVKMNSTTDVTTHYGVNSILFLVYTVDSDGAAYWKVADYNSDKKVSQYNTTTDNKYPMLFKYDAGNTSTSTKTNYVRFNNNLYVNPSTGVIYAKKFNGDLVGNADSASAVKTSSGNVTIWKGTKAQYDAIATKDESCLYIVTDDVPVKQTWSLTMSDGTVIERDVVLYD